MITIKRKILITIVAVILLFTLFTSWTCFSASAQNSIAFTTADTFDIPAYNSTICFAINGTYTTASLENGTWHFVNLHLDNAGDLGTLPIFNASAQNSNVTITSCQEFSGSLTGVRLRYTVVGSGAQTFNLGIKGKSSEWDVTFNGAYISENNGWDIASDGTLTVTGVTGATTNVSIARYTFSNDFGGSGDVSDQTFIQQHSVAITTGIVVAVAIVLVVVIKVKTKTNETENPVVASIKNHPSGVQFWKLSFSKGSPRKRQHVRSCGNRKRSWFKWFDDKLNSLITKTLR